MKTPAVRSKATYIKSADLTPMQREFVRNLVREGKNPSRAATAAGYASGGPSSYQLMQLPHIQVAIRAERERYISGELANVATGTLRGILSDKSAPASARVQAARTVLEMSGDIGRNKTAADGDKPLADMSADELTQLIDAWQTERAAAARQLDAADVEVLEPGAADARARAEL